MRIKNQQAHVFIITPIRINKISFLPFNMFFTSVNFDIGEFQ